ncbi:MAG: hypothetical protein ACJA0Q_001784 [Saprospiraceae bacterium]|jgi:hypothetical protein
MNNKTRIIKEVRFLGIPIFKKVRTVGKELKLNESHESVLNPSISVFGKAPGFLEGLMSVFNDAEWIEKASVLIELAFYNLVLSQHLKVNMCMTRVSYFYFLSFKYVAIEVDLISSDKTGDFLSNVIINQLQRIIKSGTKTIEIKFVINNLLDFFIGKYDVNSPGKVFVNEYLVEHSKAHKEIRCRARLGWHNQVKSIEILFESGKRNDLESQYLLLKKQMVEQRRKSLTFRNYDIEIRQKIHREFKSRVISDRN